MYDLHSLEDAEEYKITPGNDVGTAKPKDKKELAPTVSSLNVKLQKNRIVSDDEDEDEAPPARPKAKGLKTKASRGSASALESDAERSLRAMMDIDDCERTPFYTSSLQRSLTDVLQLKSS